MTRRLACALALLLSFCLPYEALAARTGDGGVGHNIATTTSPPTGQPFTAMGWANFADLSTYWPIFHADSAGHASYVEVTTDLSAAGKIDLIASDALGNFISVTQTSTSTSVGTWCHWAASCASNNDWRVYLNAGGKGTSSSAVTLSTVARLTIGGFNDATTIYAMNGSMAAFAWWTTAQTDDAVASFAAGQSPIRGPHREALVLYAPLDGDATGELDVVGQLPLTVSSGTKAERKPGLVRGGRR